MSIPTATRDEASGAHQAVDAVSLASAVHL
jgi:hypothetical protein